MENSIKIPFKIQNDTVEALELHLDGPGVVIEPCTNISVGLRPGMGLSVLSVQNVTLKRGPWGLIRVEGKEILGEVRIDFEDFGLIGFQIKSRGNLEFSIELRVNKEAEQYFLVGITESEGQDNLN